MNHQHHQHQHHQQQQRRLKRKEWEPIFPAKSTPPLTTTSSPLSSPKPSAEQSVMSNQLLAGYMAHEFLTKGTLLGQKFDPARAEALPVQYSKRGKYGSNNSNWKGQGKPSGKGKPEKNSYAEVVAIVKSEGTHIPGIVNPTQLARWIQM